MITSEVLAAYTQCKLKAYLLLFTCKRCICIPHEYISILEEETVKNRAKYFSKVKMEVPAPESHSLNRMKRGTPILLEAILTFEDLEAYADAITLLRGTSSKKTHNYTPTPYIPHIG